jgi:sugar lactone lactonase YvrE
MTSKATHAAGRVRALIGLAALACLLGTLYSAATASAADQRVYDSQMTGFGYPGGLTIGQDDEVWVSDIAKGSVISQFDAFPSQTKLGQQDGGGRWGGLTEVKGMAVSPVTNFLAVGASGPGCSETTRFFYIFDAVGDIYKTIEMQGFPCQKWSAFDKAPSSDYYGDFYMYANQGGSVVERFDGYGNPVDFTFSGSYVSGNEITGTPFGPFSGNGPGGFTVEESGITVDGEGNIWVIDEGKREIDQFAPSGQFIKRITKASSGVPDSDFGSYPGLAGIAVDPLSGNVLVGDKVNGVVDEFDGETGKFLGQLQGTDTPAGHFKVEFIETEFSGNFEYSGLSAMGFNSDGYFYVADPYSNGVVDIFKPKPTPTVAYKPDTNATETSATLNATVAPNGGGDITACKFEYGTTTAYSLGSKTCVPDPSGTPFSVATDVHADISTLTPEQTYHYRVQVTGPNGTRVGKDQTFTPHKVIGLRADPATAISATGATLNGSFIGNGAATKYYFEYGTTTAYGKRSALPPGISAGSPPGPGRTLLSFGLTELDSTTRYHYRIVASNGSLSKSDDQTFITAPLAPVVKESATDVHSNEVKLTTQINPGGADTTFNFEYGTEKCSVSSSCTLVSPEDIHIGMGHSLAADSMHLDGLTENTRYYYRVVATNSVDTVYGPDRSFSTAPFSNDLKDNCPNALARQQTGAALLLDCRAYELVSSAHAGGYDVESNLVPGQEPFKGYPDADDRAVYGVHNGAIPNVPGNPTNRGIDPYIAARGANGWSTSYVGLPANNPDATAPFASTLLAADAALNTFVFGGPEICSPCFPDNSSGLPTRLPDGSLVQGMTGTTPQPAAKSDGLVTEPLSADGTHLVFSSTSPFEPGANTNNGDVSIYDRDLTTGVTQVVSKDGLGNNLACLQGAGQCHAPGNANGIAQLDISEDGSRIVLGQKISTDADGNVYYHLYMHIGSAASSVDLTPGATAGALYNGMTADGSRVFFTTKDHAVGTDTDTMADIFEAVVDDAGAVTRRLVSTKGAAASNDESCEPVGRPNSWNAISGDGKCSAVAIAGGAGVASGDGTFYFLSPEQLEGAKGQAGMPNLYLVAPGSTPKFVATVDSEVGKAPPGPPVRELVDDEFLTGLGRPESIAVDQESGDLYVAETENSSFEGQVSRWKSDGTPHNFSSTPGSNVITGQYFGFEEGQVAVDNSSGPFKGAFYATNAGTGEVGVYASSGEKLGALTGFSYPCGVSVDQSNGDVYVGDLFAAEIKRYRPISAAKPVTNASYQPVESAQIYEMCNIDASADGHVYSWPFYGGEVQQYEAFEFEAIPHELTGKPLAYGIKAQSDPTNGNVFVDQEFGITEFDAERNTIGAFGFGEINESRAIGVNGTTEHVYVTTQPGPGEPVTIMDYANVPPAYEPIDSPFVLHAVHDNGVYRSDDFQITRSGRFAAFASAQMLDEDFDNNGHSQVFRYDADAGDLRCVSCPPSGVPALADGALADHGLSLVEDGRVFFDSNDALVLRDGDGRQDVYQWEEEGVGNCTQDDPNQYAGGGFCISLISSGTSPFDSALLTASSDGEDAFFFTHDSLGREDENGPITKLYDAREEGGFFAVPPPARCVASDECHGPGTEAAGPPNIRTVTSKPSNVVNTKKPCKKGYKKKKNGKCKKKKRKHSKPKRTHGKGKGGSR